MPAPYNTVDTLVQVATVEAGPYTDVGYTRSFDLTEGSEGETVLRWFGGDETRAGAPTLSGSLNIWWDLEDTDGQNVIRTAKRAGSLVWLRFLLEGDTPGGPFESFEASITEVSRSGDVEGDAVEGSFSFSGSPSTFDEGTLDT